MGDGQAHDQRRDAWLRAEGIEVLRISARAVLQDVSGVVSTIQAALAAPSLSPETCSDQRGRCGEGD